MVEERGRVIGERWRVGKRGVLPQEVGGERCMGEGQQVRGEGERRGEGTLTLSWLSMTPLGFPDVPD